MCQVCLCRAQKKNRIYSTQTKSSIVRGHSTTTWTEFCHFLTPPPSCVDSFYTLSVDKNRYFLTPSPHLVHVVIEWPLKRFHVHVYHLHKKRYVRMGGKIVPFIMEVTPARSHFISGLKSRVLKLTFFCLKIMIQSCLEFYFEIHRAPSELLLPSAKKSAH